jgi:hypothetical protein
MNTFTVIERTVKRHSHADVMKQIRDACVAKQIRGICMNNFPRLTDKEMLVKNLTTEELSQLVSEVIADSVFYTTHPNK